MSFKGQVNHIRRKIMRGLTSNIGRSSLKKYAGKKHNIEIERVLINRPNSRLGNQLLVMPLVQEIVDTFPECKIDLFVRGGLSPILYEQYENVDRIIRLPGKPFKELPAYIKVWFTLRKYRYDMVINVDKSSSSGRLATLFTRGKIKFFCDAYENVKSNYAGIRHIAKFPVYNLRFFLNSLGFKASQNPVHNLDIKLTDDELKRGKELLDDLVSSDRKTISIYTFATGSKCYSREWWYKVYTELVDTFGDKYNILEVLPAENVSQIDFKAPSFYSRNIRDIAALIANTEVFIGADSGIMHLASSSQTPTVGLFAFTDTEVYEPYGNGSIAIDTNVTDVNHIIKIADKILSDRNKIVSA